jgi:hypothetical protein
MNKYDILEECLKALEDGQTIDAALARYPKYASELRPLLETALQARTLGGAAVPGQFQARNRNRLIRRAAEMREAKRVAHRRLIPFFPRFAITLGVVAALVLGSTGLVSASGNAIPGDQLYPVKRTWEDVRLLFAFSPQEREILQSQYEQERLNEIDELLVKGRGSTSIVFSGIVTQLQDGSWKVSGIPVFISSSTILPQGAITNSAPVMVIGVTRNDGVVEAQEIQLLQPGAPLPPFEPSDNEHGNLKSISTPAVQEDHGTPVPRLSNSANPQASYEFSGVVESMENGLWTINGQSVRVDRAQVDGNIQVGTAVQFQGYYDSNGEFIASKVSAVSGGDSSNARRGNNGNENGSPSQGNGEGEGKGEAPGGGTPPAGGDH